MNELRNLLNDLVERGWTYTALGEELGVRRDTVWNWHRGAYAPRAPHAIEVALRVLTQQDPPLRRRYGPDAPQRRPKKRPGSTDALPG